eukprot:gene4752-867_t
MDPGNMFASLDLTTPLPDGLSQVLLWSIRAAVETGRNRSRSPRKVVLVSSDHDQVGLFHLPIICAIWKQRGWEALATFVGNYSQWKSIPYYERSPTVELEPVTSQSTGDSTPFCGLPQQAVCSPPALPSGAAQTLADYLAHCAALSVTYAGILLISRTFRFRGCFQDSEPPISISIAYYTACHADQSISANALLACYVPGLLSEWDGAKPEDTYLLYTDADIWPDVPSYYSNAYDFLAHFTKWPFPRQRMCHVGATVTHLRAMLGDITGQYKVTSNYDCLVNNVLDNEFCLFREFYNDFHLWDEWVVSRMLHRWANTHPDNPVQKIPFSKAENEQFKWRHFEPHFSNKKYMDRWKERANMLMRQSLPPAQVQHYIKYYQEMEELRPGADAVFPWHEEQRTLTQTIDIGTT